MSAPRTGTLSRRVVAEIIFVYVLAVAAWFVLSPRESLQSLGDGYARSLPDSATAEATQFVIMMALLSSASIATAIIVWARLPGRRGPRLVLLTVVVTGVCAILAAYIAHVITGYLPVAGDTIRGEEIIRNPEIGPAYTGSPATWFSWSSGWGWLGWAVLPSATAATTMGFVAFSNIDPSLGVKKAERRQKM